MTEKQIRKRIEEIEVLQCRLHEEQSDRKNLSRARNIRINLHLDALAEEWKKLKGETKQPTA